MRAVFIALLLMTSPWWATQSHAASEIEEWASISGRTQAAFLRDDFSRLEEMSKAYRTGKSRTSSGLWKLSVFDRGILTGIDMLAKDRERESAFREIEAKTLRWTQRYPNSPSAHIAHAFALISHGWAFRGTGYASTVRPEAWAPFRDYIAKARRYLESHKAVAAIDPGWYEAMLVVARAQNWTRAKFDQLVDEALDREPLYYETYFRALEYLLPRWHGGLRDIEEFARDAVRRTSNQEGRGMYARIYWYASQSEFLNKIFANSLAVWPLMKAGFEDVIARYPDDWNLNNYARFACLAGDKPKTLQLLKRTESSIVWEAWSPLSLRRKCSAWAHGTRGPKERKA